MEQIHQIEINGQLFELNLTDVVSHLTSPDGTDYLLLVDNNGNLYTKRSTQSDVQPLNPPGDATKGKIYSFSGDEENTSKLYINSLYCGGASDENSLNYCSHNFVELSNLTKADINLSGMTLQYAIDGSDWKVLPLQGVIPAGGTFLIRGKQCSKMDSPTTKIKVKSYDMEWYLDGSLISFENAVSAKFYLCFNSAKCDVDSPYNNTAGAVTSTVVGYIDLIGIRGTKNPGGYEGKDSATATSERKNLSGKYLFRKYYAMDPVSQATKAVSARKNSNDWCYVDLTKEDGDLIPNIEAYTPKASFEGKTLFYNKTDLDENKPSMITCSFGIQATDGGSSARATRCFNWLAGKPGFNYIWIKPESDTSWGTANKAFEEGDGRTHHTDHWYNTKISQYTNNRVLFANKFIKTGLSAGRYQYVAGRKKSDGSPDLEHCTDVRSFVVRESDNVGSFNFVQTSDQQGFNWEEYQMWAAASKVIMEESGSTIDFMINTGDMTQNGNRLCEWLDYFAAKCPDMQNLEEMATIGNNDLSPMDLKTLGNGKDATKISLENIMFFYTFETDDDNKPEFEINGVKYYVPSLYSFNYGNVHFVSTVSEIKPNLEKVGYGFTDGGNFYPHVKQWVLNDFAKYGKTGSTGWNIGYCHEMPFTILTRAVTNNPGKRTNGSNANTNTPTSMEYWLSEFFQTHNFPLVIGGHKHTQATSWPLIENITGEGDSRTVDSQHPIIVVTSAELTEFNGSTTLKAYDGRMLPDKWFVSGSDTINEDFAKHAELCTFMMRDSVPEGLTPVIYAMSQATGYKHTSNKELPSSELPWLRYYFPSSLDGTTDVANDGQKFPFYTVWQITPTTITGNVRKVYGGFNNKGKFDVNAEWPYVKEGYSAVEKDWSTRIHSINGITSMTTQEAETDTRTTNITK